MATHSGPLRQKTVLIACSEAKAARLEAGLRNLGAEVLVFPVIRIRRLADTGALDASLNRLEDYAWILFTSAYGVRLFLERARERSIARERFRNIMICAIGPATAEELANSGFKVDLIPREYVAEGLVDALAEKYGGLQRLSGLRILLPRAQEGRDVIPQALENAGARVDLVPCYENILPETDPARLQAALARLPDLLVFTSSSTVTNFAALFGDQGRQMLQSAKVAAIGPITAQTVARFGKPPEIVPGENSIPSLLEAIREYYCR